MCILKLKNDFSILIKCMVIIYCIKSFVFLINDNMASIIRVKGDYDVSFYEHHTRLQ